MQIGLLMNALLAAVSSSAASARPLAAGREPVVIDVAGSGWHVEDRVVFFRGFFASAPVSMSLTVHTQHAAAVGAVRRFAPDPDRSR
jgi:hypothetical protein